MNDVGCVKQARRSGGRSPTSEAVSRPSARGTSFKSRAARGRLGALAVSAVALVVASVTVGWSIPASAAGIPALYRPDVAFSDVSPRVGGELHGRRFRRCAAARPRVVPEPIYATEAAGVWSKAIAIPAPEQGGVFTAVSCPTANGCTAVGYDYSAAISAPLVGYPIYATESDGRWSAAREITSSVGGFFLTATGAGFTSVSCAAVGDCTAVGGNGPMYATESHGIWGPATFLDTETFAGYFNAVSCTSATNCTAVGNDESYNGMYAYFSTNEPISAIESAGSWSTPTEVAAPDGSTGSFDGVSCSAEASCTAVGTATSGPIDATETAGTWSAATGVEVPGTDGSLAAVSCTAARDCTAVGTSSTQGFGTVNDESIHLREFDGTWSTAVVDGGGAFAGVSCPSTTGCTVVGSLDVCGFGVNFCAGPSGEYPIFSTEGTGAWKAVPGAPTLKRVTTDNREIEVDWASSSSRGGPVVAGYTAVAVIRTHDIVRAFSRSTGRSSCTIRGVTNGKTYSVSVYARSAAGSSATSTTRRAVPHARRQAAS